MSERRISVTQADVERIIRHAYECAQDPDEAAQRWFDALPATPPASETVDAAWEAFALSFAPDGGSRARIRTGVKDYRLRIEAAIRAEADERGPAYFAGWENGYEAGRAEADDPTMDGTDGAHPAWWRGSDYGYAKVRAEADERVRALRREVRETIEYTVGILRREGKEQSARYVQEHLDAALDAAPEDAHKP